MELDSNLFNLRDKTQGSHSGDKRSELEMIKIHGQYFLIVEFYNQIY